MSYIAVDIGATKLRVGRGSTSGLEATLVSPTPVDGGPEAIPRQIISMIEALGVSRPRGVGIGSIGPLDLSQGAIGETPNFPHNHIPLVEPLREHLGSPVTLVNDCSAAVVGEKVYGAGRGLENLVYITMSTGPLRWGTWPSSPDPRFCAGVGVEATGRPSAGGETSLGSPPTSSPKPIGVGEPSTRPPGETPLKSTPLNSSKQPRRETPTHKWWSRK